MLFKFYIEIISYIGFFLQKLYLVDLMNIMFVNYFKFVLIILRFFTFDEILHSYLFRLLNTTINKIINFPPKKRFIITLYQGPSIQDGLWLYACPKLVEKSLPEFWLLHPGLANLLVVILIREPIVNYINFLMLKITSWFQKW